ncbi:MAG: DUF2065 domain-containing protein [bacterium]|nr:DUF2065 domain-containing protein [bacterium]
MEFFLCVIGMVFIIEGIPSFLFPGVWKRMLVRIDNIPDSRLRRLGLVSILIGLAIIYLGRR